MVTAAADDSTPARPLPVRGRAREIAALSAVLGRGGALVLSGAPGVGTTTLLDHVAHEAEGFRVLRACGTASEAGLALAGLHQLLRPVRDLVGSLEAGQRDLLRCVFGLGEQKGERFALGTAVHALLNAAAAERPTVCCVDSAHELDADSLAALVFCARRCENTRLAFVFGADPGTSPEHADFFADLPSLWLRPLGDDAAVRLLTDRLGAGLRPDLVDDLLDLARGNPRALTEVADALTADQLSGLAALPRALPREGRLCRTMRRRLATLPDDARLLVLLAALDDRLDLATVSRVLPSARALDDATASGLVTVTGDAAVRLSDDVLGGAIVTAAAPAERQGAHRLLAEAADPAADRFRWTWHRAATASAPAPRLASELDHVAESARLSRHHHQAAAASERAAALSPDGERKALRLVSAATDHWAAGRPRRARSALREVTPLATGGVAGLAGMLSGEIELRSGNPAVAAAGLLSTAHQLAGSDDPLAAPALLLAGEASCVAGDNARYCATARDAARLRGTGQRLETRLVLEHFAAMAATFSGRHAEAAGPLRQVVELGTQAGGPVAKILASQAAFTLGDAGRARDLALRAASSARAQGNPAQVPWALVYVSLAALLTGEHATATSASLEGMRLAESLGQRNCVVSHLTVLALLAALRGDRETAALRLDAAASGVLERGLGRPNTLAAWAAACGDLADDRPADALNRFRRMATGPHRRYAPVRTMAVPQLVEAAVRCGRRDVAARALPVFEHWAGTTGGPARVALVHRCHALLAEDEREAEDRFAEAIRLHRTADAAFDLANTELLYAARLRRARQPRQARDVLREAEQIFDELDAQHWARRTRRELRACGHPVHRGSAPATSELTAQQERIAALVAQGATNREIAASLFISHRTVDHHLRNVFARLGIRSRVQLASLYR